MYQQQLTLLMKKFHRYTHEQYELVRLLNDADYRNRALQHQSIHGASSTQILIRQIHAFEDVLHHELRVDFIPPKPRKQTVKLWRLSLFALVCLTFAVSALAIVEDIKSQRENQTIQAE